MESDFKLYPPLNKKCTDLPKELSDLLNKSNGIMEVMEHPKTGELMNTAWIIYPYDTIIEETEYYRKEYSVEGYVLSTNGAGDPFILKSDGSITLLDCIDNEENLVLGSLEKFLDKAGVTI